MRNVLQHGTRWVCALLPAEGLTALRLLVREPTLDATGAAEITRTF